MSDEAGDIVKLAGSAGGGASLGVVGLWLAQRLFSKFSEAEERKVHELEAQVAKMAAEKDATRERQAQEDRAEVASLGVLLERVAGDVRSLLEHQGGLLERVKALETRCAECPGRVP